MVGAGMALGTVAAAAAAQDPDPGAADPPASVAPEAAEEGEAEPGPADPALEAYWSRRLSNARDRIGLARERAEKAEAEYSRARHDRNPRGEALDEILQRHEGAQEELRAATAALPRLVEQARRAGVPPGVLRDYWDDDVLDDVAQTQDE